SVRARPARGRSLVNSWQASVARRDADESIMTAAFPVPLDRGVAAHCLFARQCRHGDWRHARWARRIAGEAHQRTLPKAPRHFRALASWNSSKIAHRLNAPLILRFIRLTAQPSSERLALGKGMLA